MNITALSLKRPVTTVMLFVCFATIGTISARLLPLEKFPDIEFPGVFVEIPYQGSTPEEVERLITRPIEESISTLGGIRELRSTSSRDGAQIQVFFSWDKDVAVKGIEVRDRIDAVRDQLPADVERIFVAKFSAGDAPILTIRLSSNRDLSDAYDMLDRNIKRRLERIEGVSQVRLYGVEKREIRIQLDADRVAAHGVDLRELSRRLQSANFAMSAGRITDNGLRYTVHLGDEFHTIEDIENFVLDSNLRLGDIADVTYASPERNYGRHLDRRYAIGLDVFKETGANIVEVSRRVLTEIEAIKNLPQMEGITIFFMDNHAEGIEKSLSDLANAGLVGALLSLIVLYFFLRQLPTTLMVTLAVPCSLSIALAVMYFTDISLNILSLMGLMLAVGMLVDNAVVVTESIFQKKQSGMAPHEAALRGTSEVGLAVTAGTLTTVIVFLPNIFGEQNQITVFLSHVAVAIVVSLLASLFISLTMIPMIAARIPPPEPGMTQSIDRLKFHYERILAWTLDHRWKTAGLIFLILVSAAIPIGLVKKDMFPQEGVRRLFMRAELNGTYELQKVEDAINQIEKYLYANKEVFEIRSVYTYFDVDEMQITVLLTDEDEARRPTEEIREEIRKGMPVLAIGQPTFDFERSGTQEGVRIQLAGESSEVLAELSRDVARILATVEGLTDVRSEAMTGGQEIQVTVNKERAIQHGLSASDVAGAIAVAIRGQNLRYFRGSEGEVPIRLVFSDRDRQTLTDLSALVLQTPAGGQVPLTAIADISVTRGPDAIHRENRMTAVGIAVSLANGVTMNDIKPRIEKVMNQIVLPPGYVWSFGRSFEEEDETVAIMLQNMLLAVLLIFIVMAALFESILHPFAIISGILFSIVGVFWFFLATGTTFSFMALIGILILMGVVVNNGIVMVHHINHLRREGMTRREAVLMGARDRLRPILMTVATTILGLIPLAAGTTQIGGDGPPYFPMARAIIGGLAFSTVVSLFVLPSIYLMFDDFGAWLRECATRARTIRPLRSTTEERNA